MSWASHHLDSWANLAAGLHSHYPDDWAERFHSYVDGSNSDVQLWRGIGGEVYVPAPRGHRPPNPLIEARNERVRAAAKACVPVSLLADRFRLSTSAIGKIVAGQNEAMSR